MLAGQPAEFACRMANKRGFLTWLWPNDHQHPQFLENYIADSYAPHYSVRAEPNDSQASQTPRFLLTIKAARLADEGELACLDSSRPGEKSRLARLEVLQAPTSVSVRALEAAEPEEPPAQLVQVSLRPSRARSLVASAHF